MSTVKSGDQNPFVGPIPFGETDLIYGREQELPRLVDLFVAQRIVLFYGPSGAGKTSLIEAKNGLRSLMSGLEFTVWPTISVKLTTDAGASDTDAGLNRYVSSVLQSLERGRAENLRAPPDELRRMSLAAYFARQDAAGDERLDVLIFDQLEQIFAIDPIDQESNFAFFAQVGDLLRDRRRWALFSMREDYIASLDPYLRLIPTQLSTTYRLDILVPDAARRAIQQPAEDGGVAFTDGAADALVENLRIMNVQAPNGQIERRAGPGVEPLFLQVVCRGLWQDLVVGQNKQRIEPEDIDSVEEAGEAQPGGGNRDFVDQKLISYYEEGLREVLQSEDVRKAGVDERDLRFWFDTDLITKQDVRPQLLLGNDYVGSLPVVAVWPLVDENLVRKDDRRGLTWFELAHDRLIRPIRQSNAAWFVANLGPLELQAKQWEQSNFADGFLLTGDALRNALELQEKHPDQLSDLEAKLVERSHVVDMKRAEEENKRRLAAAEATAALERQLRVVGDEKNRLLRVLAVLLMLAALGLGVLLWRQKDTSDLAQKIAHSRHLAAQALRVMPSELDLALLLSVAANEDEDAQTAESKASLLSTLLASPHVKTFMQTDISVAKTAAINPLDKTLVVGGCATPIGDGCNNGAIQFWQLPSGEMIDGLETLGLKDVKAVTYSSNGKFLAAAADGLMLWDLSDGQHHILPFGDPDDVCKSSDYFSVAFSPDSRMVVAGAQDGCIRLWDIEPGWRRLLKLWDSEAVRPRLWRKIHTGAVNSLAFSKDGMVASGSSDKSVILWDPARGEPIGEPIAEHSAEVWDVAFDRSGNSLASSSLDGRIIVSDVARKQPNWEIIGTGPAVLSIAFSPTADLLASSGGASSEPVVKLWDVSDSRAPEPQPLKGYNGSVFDLTFSSDGNTLVSVGQDQPKPGSSQESTVILWTVTDGQPLSQLVSSIPEAKDASGAAFSQDGTLLVSVGRDGGVVWDISSGERLGSIAIGPESRILSLAFSSGAGPLLAAGANDGTIAIWNPQNIVAGGDPKPDVTWRLPTPSTQVTSVAFSPDGKMLATGTNDSDGTIFLWDPATSAQLREPLINRDTSNLPRSKQKTVLSVAFNADGTRLAAGREDGTIEVWDVVEGKPLGAPMLGHKGALRSLAFSPEPDQKLLASGGNEGRLILWDTESTLSIEPHLADIDKEEWYVSFRPDGQLLTFTRSKGDVVVWDVRVKTWQEKACGVANRPLTDHEWMRYVGGNDREPLCLDAINDDQSATATTE